MVIWLITEAAYSWFGIEPSAFLVGMMVMELVIEFALMVEKWKQP